MLTDRILELKESMPMVVLTVILTGKTWLNLNFQFVNDLHDYKFMVDVCIRNIIQLIIFHRLGRQFNDAILLNLVE